MAAEPCAGDEAIVVLSNDPRDLANIARADVQAVILVPPAPPAWLADVAAAVETGRLRLPRSVLPYASRDDISAWLNENVRVGMIDEPARSCLIRDVLELTDRLGNLVSAGGAVRARRFMLRIFTEAPTTECGFHVDSVPPAAPGFGLLRVYNGAGTLYADPANVTSMADFYSDLGQRDRLVKARTRARQARDAAALEQLERDIAAHDAARPFLRRPEEVAEAPSGSIVAFKHIDVRRHRSGHAKAEAWLHCSPMAGEARLVVNLTVPQPIHRPRAAHPATPELSSSPPARP